MQGTENLKILIVSTPKTGNTWCRHLFSVIYDLPMVSLSYDFRFNAEEFEQLGPRWITHHHYPLIPEMAEWLKANQVVVMTTVRHPADTLLSLYHYARQYKTNPQIMAVLANILQREATVGDQDGFVKDLEGFVRQGFDLFLERSLEWLRPGISYRVRYEDLWFEPVATLEALTAKIQPVPLEHLERAVEFCDISLLRATSGSDGPKFYRRGGVGEWRETIAPDILELLGTLPPYPALFAELGYNLDPRDQLYNQKRSIPAWRNPFREVTHFNNGIAVAPIVMQCYLSIEASQSAQWGQAQDASRTNSFFAWLNAPAQAQPEEGQRLPLISNLAAYIYRRRSDLQKAFPKAFGQNRADYANWFVNHAGEEYQLDKAFIAPVSDSMAEWGKSPVEGQEGVLPLLTNFMVQIYNKRPDLQTAFPDIFGSDRAAFVEWFVFHAQENHDVTAEEIRRAHQNFVEWAVAPVAGAEPAIPNLASLIYARRPDLQQAFPNPYTQDLKAFREWFFTRPVTEFSQYSDIFNSINSSYKV